MGPEEVGLASLGPGSGWTRKRWAGKPCAGRRRTLHVDWSTLAAHRAAGVGLLWPGGGRRDRGRSHLTPELQAAEAWALGRFGPARARDLDSEDADGVVRVRHGQTRVDVRVTRIDTGDEAPLSCGKLVEPVIYWSVDPL